MKKISVGNVNVDANSNVYIGCTIINCTDYEKCPNYQSDIAVEKKSIKWFNYILNFLIILFKPEILEVVSNLWFTFL